MAQGVLPFKYEAEKNRSGMTALAGLPTYLDLASVCGLQASIDRHVGVRRGTQGWSDAQVLMSLILLNLAGGDCVDDLSILQGDPGFAELMYRVETHDMARRERRALLRRFRKERRRQRPHRSFGIFGRFMIRTAQRPGNRAKRSFRLRASIFGVLHGSMPTWSLSCKSTHRTSMRRSIKMPRWWRRIKPTRSFRTNM